VKRDNTLPAEIALLKPASPVTWLALAKTKPMAATIARDHQLRIVSMPDGAERRAIDVTGRAIDVFAIAPNGEAVAIGDHMGGVSVWATDTGRSRLELRLRRYPGLALFSHNGATLALTAQGDPVQLIDVASGRKTASLGQPVGGTNVIAFSRDDRLVATGDGDAVVRIFDAASGRLIAENRESTMIPLAIEFTADGATVLAGGGDRALLFIDAATGKTTRRMDRLAQPPAYLEVSPDGASFVAAYMKAENMSQPDHVFILPVKDGPPQLDWLPPTMPVGAGWTHDGRLIAAFSAPDGLHLWRLR
jgi:WD40 repeat protein